GGLKGVGKLYIPETNVVLRQDLPTEGNTAAASENHISSSAVPSSRSTGICTSCF
ncbi:hypothetical protein A2U01_0019970, partial [Trifolium medium]|nr:hypothetical protein [Trifolium medium]